MREGGGAGVSRGQRLPSLVGSGEHEVLRFPPVMHLGKHPQSRRREGFVVRRAARPSGAAAAERGGNGWADGRAA
ncbi:unnamed protein product [Lampetra fluviatilis]